MRIVHFSDWHWEFTEHPDSLRFQLPEADIYVCTGDMMDNFPVVSGGWGGDNNPIRPENERVRQGEDIKHFVAAGGFKRYLGTPDAPILCVRGNHDFIDLGRLFEGCNFIHEFVDNEVVEVLGLKASGHRGIPYIYGSWNDEVQRPDLMDRIRRIPKNIDLLLTHYPPSLILDIESIDSRGGVRAYGMEGMSGIVFNRLNVGGVHMFGHIHGSGGRIERVDDMLFSNAATKHNVLEI
jgi:Icc-related predicted phosphoesterase